MPSRRKILISLGAGLGLAGAGGYLYLKPRLSPEPAPVGFDLKDGTLESANALLKKHPAVDIHSHPGRTFTRDAGNLTWKLKLYAMMGTFEKRTIDDMVAGGVSTVNFAGVADFPVLDAGKSGLNSVREFHSGEAWKYYKAQLQHLRKLVANGWVEPVFAPKDIATVHSEGKIGMMLSMEGGDFLEGKLSRVQTVFDDGLRMLTLVHYKNNSIGDIMTQPLEDGGLSGFGREVVGEMGRLGMMIDLSHASNKTALDVMAIAKNPVALTHTHVRSTRLDHPRFVSGELADAVVQAGGIIGAWPAGIGISTLAGFIERIDELVQNFGDEGVGIGSDMDANYKPVYGNFRQMSLIVGALMERGYKDDSIARIIGGNFIRVFDANMNG